MILGKPSLPPSRERHGMSLRDGLRWAATAATTLHVESLSLPLSTRLLIQNIPVHFEVIIGNEKSILRALCHIT